MTQEDNPPRLPPCGGRDEGPWSDGPDGEHGGPMSVVASGGGGRHRLATAVMLVAVGMVPWIVFLGLTLPQRYQTVHWNLLWVGFDAALVLVLVATALTAWVRRQFVAPLLLVAATLLVCDAWFDVVTSAGRPGGWVSIVTAVCGELPLAGAFGWLYHRIVLGSIQEARRRAGDPHPRRRLRDVRLPALGARPETPPGVDGDRR